MAKNSVPLLGLYLILCACEPNGMARESLQSQLTQNLNQHGTNSIEVNFDGQCFARELGPFEIEIVDEVVISKPEVKNENGSVVSPAVFKHVRRPQKRYTNEGERFEAICPQLYTRELISALQRALFIRGYYSDTITGNFDTKTQAAVQNYQIRNGINSATVGVEMARGFGLISAMPL